MPLVLDFDNIYQETQTYSGDLPYDFLIYNGLKLPEGFWSTPEGRRAHFQLLLEKRSIWDTTEERKAKVSQALAQADEYYSQLREKAIENARKMLEKPTISRFPDPDFAGEIIETVHIKKAWLEGAQKNEQGGHRKGLFVMLIEPPLRTQRSTLHIPRQRNDELKTFGRLQEDEAKESQIKIIDCKKCKRQVTNDIAYKALFCSKRCFDKSRQF